MPLKPTQDLFPHARWSRRKIGLVLYPFAAAAVAINLYMLSLMLQAIGLTTLSPVWAVILSLPLGLPATWGFTVWVERLLDEAAEK
jgi:hypothetical protein